MQFDAESTKKFERVYSTPDLVQQRDKVLSLVNLQTGERALDIGTATGMTTQAIGKTVGENGSVIGIDINDDALVMAKRRCADQPWVSFEKCDAADLPFEDASFDVAVATQTYEFVDDIDTALAELYRVLCAGGRAVILDSDWDSCVWHTTNRERMHRVIDLWNTHCAKPFLPRTLKQDVERAGFEVIQRDVHTVFNPDYDPNTYSHGMVDVILSYVKGIEGVSHAEVDSWAEELHHLGAEGEYFFSLNRYIFVVQKP